MRAPYWVRAGGAIVVSLMLADPAWAGVDEGVAAYNRGDYVTAVHEFRLLAEQGDAIAQFNLGIMYYMGKGVPQDYAAPVTWYRLAAVQATPRPSSTSGSCTTWARACRRITRRQ